MPLKFRASLVATVSAAAFSSFLTPSLTLAQDEAQDGQETAAASEGTFIIVDGRRAAIESAINAERDADQLVSIVTSDDIGQFGDQTVAE